VSSCAVPKVDPSGTDSAETTGRDTTFPLDWERPTEMPSLRALPRSCYGTMVPRWSVVISRVPSCAFQSRLDEMVVPIAQLVEVPATRSH